MGFLSFQTFVLRSEYHYATITIINSVEKYQIYKKEKNYNKETKQSCGLFLKEKKKKGNCIGARKKRLFALFGKTYISKA